MEDESDVQELDLAFEIFLEALSCRPQIPRDSFGDHFGAFSLQQIVTETLTARVHALFLGPDGRVPCMFFRLVGYDLPMAEAIFYPLESTLSFLSESRSHIQQLNLTERTAENKEEFARRMALEMTLIMIDSFYRRAELVQDSFISEVIAQWHLQHSINVRQWTAERGEPIPLGRNPWVERLEKTLQAHHRELSQFWKHQGQVYEGAQKIRLAEEYDGHLYKHWKLLNKIAGEDDWRHYAQGRHKDTPDDLLDKLENSDREDAARVTAKLSELAVEHAGRRARLINKRGISETDRKRRREGIGTTGYTSAQLFAFLKEGREFRERLKSSKQGITQEIRPTFGDERKNGDANEETKECGEKDQSRSTE